jgi:hypothetical protein
VTGRTPEAPVARRGRRCPRFARRVDAALEPSVVTVSRFADRGSEPAS